MKKILIILLLQTTMVALDTKSGRPAKGAVPPLGEPEAEDLAKFKLRSDIARAHGKMRKRRMLNSMLLRQPVSAPPQPEEMATLHELQRAAVHALESGERPVKTVKNLTYRSSFVVYPEQRNVHGKLFGGFVMDQAYTLASFAARMFARGERVVPIGMDDATFNAPVEEEEEEEEEEEKRRDS